MASWMKNDYILALKMVECINIEGYNKLISFFDVADYIKKTGYIENGKLL